MLRSIVMACVLSFPGDAMAQPAEPVADLDALAAEALADSGAPAVGLMHWRDGELRVGVAGTREHRGDVPVQVTDRWHVGSSTKSMTAVLIARLVEQGVVDWDDTIQIHLGEVIPDMDPIYAGLNFRHLLSHRSGVRANIGMLDMIRFATEGVEGRPMPEQRLDYATQILTSEPAATAEDEFLYSNAGYVIAGAMLEQATGESWEILMRREVFLPLGLASAGFGAPGDEVIVDEPRGHRSGLFGGLSPKTGAEADNPPVLGPAGTVHLSLQDTATYLAAHLAGARGEGSGYLSTESWLHLHTPPFGGDYALGWGLQGGELLHAGSNTMWLVQWVMDPHDNEAIAIAFNDGGINRLQPVLGRVADELMGD